MNVRRIATAPVEPEEDLNIYPQYPIQSALWIWHPEKGRDDHVVLEFRRVFSLSKKSSFRLHVSADMRYELCLNDQLISTGPDRSDDLHWSFASYRVSLPAGRHTLSARVWWIGEIAPMAQKTYRGGFICASEGLKTVDLNTGSSPWKVREIPGWSFGPKLKGAYHDIGPAFIMNGAEIHQPGSWFKPTPVSRRFRFASRGAGQTHTGVAIPGWQLYPSPLPEQIRTERRPGEIVAVRDDTKRTVWPRESEKHTGIKEWRGLLASGKKIRIAAQSEMTVLWDLQDYWCGYSVVRVSGGKGSRIDWEWAESLYTPRKKGESGDPNYRTGFKGNRDEFIGKEFRGFGDTFLPGGGRNRTFLPLWWRSGRYVQLTIRTGEEPLVIEDVMLRETRYPLENAGRFTASDPSLATIIPLAVRGMQMCSHEIYMDCPYYEQMMYVGDTRLEMLTWYAMSADSRLPERGIRLFDWSRWRTGYVAERYPTYQHQSSMTFSMIYVMMLRDYSWWRGDPNFVRKSLPGMRAQMEKFRFLINEKGLMGWLPGWPVMDWVRGWDTGNPPGWDTGDSSIFSLLFINALRAASELENAFGDPVLAQRNSDLAESMGKSVVKRYWNPVRGLFADDGTGKHFSEHAQCLALLANVAPDKRKCLRALLNEPDLSRATIYFSFYLLEVLYQEGEGVEMLKRLDLWRGLVPLGLKTPVEMPEPTRSDCHAWGSHPLFHFHASLAGIRPAAPGFSKVTVAPMPGSLTQLRSEMPHPKGKIIADLKFKNGTVAGEVILPDSLNGTFIWEDESRRLQAGKNRIG